MPTDEERREVARKLREKADHLGPNMDAHEFAHYSADVIDVDECMTWQQMAYRLSELIDPDPEQTIEPSAELGDYRSLRCPKCGGEVTIVYDDYDWWDATCDGCGYDFSFDPGKYIDFGAVQTEWTHQYAEEVANAD